MSDKLTIIQTAIEHHFKHMDEPDMISSEIMVEPHKLAESILWALEEPNKNSVIPRMLMKNNGNDTVFVHGDNGAVAAIDPGETLYSDGTRTKTSDDYECAANAADIVKNADPQLTERLGDK